MNPKYPGIPCVIHGNGAVAQVMGHVCGGVIGYPITPSTEISELYESFRAAGGCNVWGKHPFFFEPEGEHSAQSGALGAALTGGKYISNASSSQGILYGLESHYVTVGKRVGGFVLQVAARVVSRHSLNVMAGHDDVYALLNSGYTILFGSNPQEAADLAAMSYKISATSLIPVANAMDGFATSHMLSECRMPEPDLLRDFIGDPEGRIKCPTVAQEMLFGAKGRVFQLKHYLKRHGDDFLPEAAKALTEWLDAHAEAVEADNEGKQIGETIAWVPDELSGQWRRQWLNAPEKGTRQRVPALVDVNNPGLTGGVQNQPDFQAGVVDHRTHFVNAVPGIVREVMAEYSELTGREYKPVMSFMADDADYVVVGLGSVTDDAEAVAEHMRKQGHKVGVISVKLLQPFPEAEIVAALAGKKAVTVLERSDMTELTSRVSQALLRARENAADATPRHAGIPPISELPRMTTAIFGLGAHDLQPRHMVACFKNMEKADSAPFIYLGSQFFSKNPSPWMAEVQAKLKAAYPETEFMALETEPNPQLLPEGAFRIRFHSVGGYGTMATGKLLTDVLAGALNLHSKAAPKYGSEKSGAPTNYYITLSPETVKLTNAELEDVEIVISPDHKVFEHSNPLRGLQKGGTFIMQSSLPAVELWASLPASARRTIRERQIKFFVIDGFSVAKRHAPTPELETRMMGIAFIGAVCGHVDRVIADHSPEQILGKIHSQITKKFGAKGNVVVESNMAVIREGLDATHKVDYDDPAFVAAEQTSGHANVPSRSVTISAEMSCHPGTASANFLDPEYYEEMVAEPFREGTIAEAPVLPGIGFFMPPGSAAGKDKGLFRRHVPAFNADLCTGCMECALVCPDAAIPNTVHEIHDLIESAARGLDLPSAQMEAVRGQVYPLSDAVRAALRGGKKVKFADAVATAAAALPVENPTLKRNLGRLAEALAIFPVAQARPFFDAMEKKEAGTGGLFSAVVDPWKCSGCLECVDVCGPHALVAQEQDEPLLETLQARFEFLSHTPNTSPRFFDDAVARAGGDSKRLLLDRGNYYATTGGHGACRGCGEVTAIRQVTSTNQAIHDKRRRLHIRELEGLIDNLRGKLTTLKAEEADRKARIEQTIATLEKRLYLFESGPTGKGPSATVIANSTGCSSVYASTFPFNPYNDPWVNSLFQDAQPLAKGIFEGLTAGAVEDVRALRVAKLELEDAYEPAVHDAYFRYLNWAQFTPEELDLLPTVMTIGGDGATYDIGFGALSRLLATRTPVKVLVLNSGVYSNTGGQASTASPTATDSDLSRFGKAHHGKIEDRKELGLIAAFHPRVFVVQTCSAVHGHFLKNVIEFLKFNEGPALLDSYTPCQAEHGIADAQASREARFAVETRMNPLFVHDPRRGTALRDRFDLSGNPEMQKDWATGSIAYVDAEGKSQVLRVSLTPADLARGETRFKKHFKVLKDDTGAVEIADYVALDPAARVGKTPFVWGLDTAKHLVKLSCSEAIVDLVEERRKNWRTLQYLAGLDVQKLDDDHRAQLEAMKAQYAAAEKAREETIDQIARGMSQLAASSKAPTGGIGLAAAAAPAASAPAASAPAAAAPAAGGAFVAMDPNAAAKCTNCGTCYGDMPEVFEKTNVVVEGVAKEVARIIPGALQKITLTPELRAKAAKVAATCDAEIIHEAETV